MTSRLSVGTWAALWNAEWLIGQSPTLEQAPDETVAGPAEFIATLSDAQVLSLRGAISDDRMRDTVDFPIIVPSTVTARIQEVHLLLGQAPQVSGDVVVGELGPHADSVYLSQ